jgi:phosphoglycolate phosphatase
MKIKSVIFDWSGVLSSDWDATFHVTNEILEHWGRPMMRKAEFRERYELPWMNFYKKIGLEVDPKWEYAEWEKRFPKYYHLIKPLPHGLETLKWLKARNIKVVLLSSHNHRLLECEVKEFGYSGFIDAIDGSNENKMHKIKALLEEHQIEKESTLYVGDMCHDVETAKHAGVISVAVLSGYDRREKLERAGPDFILDDVGGLPRLIEELEGTECVKARKSR